MIVDGLVGTPDTWTGRKVRIVGFIEDIRGTDNIECLIVDGSGDRRMWYALGYLTYSPSVPLSDVLRNAPLIIRPPGEPFIQGDAVKIIVETLCIGLDETE